MIWRAEAKFQALLKNMNLFKLLKISYDKFKNSKYELLKKQILL